MSVGRPDPLDAALAQFHDLFVDDPRSISRDGLAVTLDEAALALSAVLQPGLDLAESMAALDKLATGCPSATGAAVANHLFASGRFSGDRQRYGHWHNSCIDRVIASGRGIPITLAVVTIEVARRLGVDLVGVGMPGHFLVGDAHDPDWFLDGFHGGQVLSRDGCRSLFGELFGDRQEWSDSFLQPSPDRATILRMLNNLKAGFARSADPLHLALVMRMRTGLPEFAGEQREAARAMAVLN